MTAGDKIEFLPANNTYFKLYLMYVCMHILYIYMYLSEGLWVMSAGNEVGHGVQRLLQDAVVRMAVRSVHTQVLWGGQTIDTNVFIPNINFCAIFW